MAKLGDRLDFIIGRKAAGLLDEHFGIVTVDDLLRHYPRRYSEGMSVRDEGEDLDLEDGEHVTFVGTILRTELKDMRYQRGQKRQRKYLRVVLDAGGRQVNATFFNAEWIAKNLTKGTRVMLSGEVKWFRNSLQLDHPAYLVLDEDGGRMKGSKELRTIAEAAQADGGFDISVFERDFFPIYPASSKVQSWDIYACVRQVLAVLDPVPDPLPEFVVRQRGLISEDQALRAVHTAENAEQRDRAVERLRFDEAAGLQWALLRRRNSESAQSGPTAPRRDDGLVAELLGRLPFELTGGQREVLEVISGELAGPRPMNRMLQGEVGSGKTIVSLLAMLQMVDAGHQCALLAPTEVLAEQHARSMREVLGPLAMAGEIGGADNATRVALLTGSMPAARKRAVRDEIASGAAGIVIGTHALLQDAVEFHRLGLVVVDEQHRFGVEQRDQLRAKAPEGITPHLLVMTATPIPRTVALTVYGDLETSTLRELPKGRQPIATNVIFAQEQPKWLDRAWERIREEVAAGRQAYVVTARIDDEDDSKPQDQHENPRKAEPVVTLFERLRTGPLAGLRLGLMHGRLPVEEKDTVMSAFRSGEIDVLVCTTVIEVGVDVPNATVMVVYDADWFGISQLHQLRGRIGRGQHPSLCLLVTRLSSATKAAERLKAVASTLDGFELAELDLRERREGDVLGRNQSGRAYGLRLLSLIEHRDIIEDAREFCRKVFEVMPDDPGMAQLSAQFTGERIVYLEKA